MILPNFGRPFGLISPDQRTQVFHLVGTNPPWCSNVTSTGRPPGMTSLLRQRKLVGYATQPDGSLKEVTNMKIPYNSPQGLAGI
jgi:hypothetical protein